MCGISAIIHPFANPNQTRESLIKSLVSMQHRGQDSCGIVMFGGDSKSFHCEKDLGLVGQVFDRDKTQNTNLEHHMGVAHTRYRTTGKKNIKDVQPFYQGFPFGMSLAHNGNIINYSELKEELKSKHGLSFLSSNDLELFLNYFNLEFLEKGLSFNSLYSAIKRMFHKFVGSYSVVGMVANFGIFGFRDPNGIRPLVLGSKLTEGEISYMFASETAALDFCGFDYVRDISPGELVYITEDSQVVSSKIDLVCHRPCMFEWVYFAGAESTIEKKDVYQARLDFGENLANEFLQKFNPEDYDVVGAVPDTSRTSAIRISEVLNLPLREVFIKNRYLHRSFIAETEMDRANIIRSKLIPIKSEISGKNILLVDDSIVRGGTSKQIISLLRKYGVAKVTLMITCPPIKYPCSYGIDFPSKEELLANGLDAREIKEELGCDDLIYLSMEGLYKSIGLRELCTGCLDKNYPHQGIENYQFDIERTKQRRKDESINSIR